MIFYVLLGHENHVISSDGIGWHHTLLYRQCPIIGEVGVSGKSRRQSDTPIIGLEPFFNQMWVRGSPNQSIMSVVTNRSCKIHTLSGRCRLVQLIVIYCSVGNLAPQFKATVNIYFNYNAIPCHIKSTARTTIATMIVARTAT